MGTEQQGVLKRLFEAFRSGTAGSRQSRIAVTSDGSPIDVDGSIQVSSSDGTSASVTIDNSDGKGKVWVKASLDAASMCLLQEILLELKKQTVHFDMITDETIGEKDVD
jgi:hypothetical protein